ncbi:MAG: deoxynucleoside kinase [Woeseiaceae bacterium]
MKKTHSRDSGAWPSFIVVEGPIGVGKTALAEKLAARFRSSATLEASNENPFLERFYEDRQRGALPAQLFYLFNRTQQLEALCQEDLFRPVRISDFLIARDRLFAEINLDADELALYDQVAEQVAIDVPAPDLVVYLQAPVPVLKRRLSQRGAESGRLLDDEYLEKVADQYARFFYEYDDSPLLIVNAAEIDPVNNDADFEALFAQIRQTRRGRHFFNPVAAAALP